jgi:flagellar hook assembly protein FlgD
MYVVNYPNPFSDATYFTFQHNLTETIDVDIQIFSVAGRKIKQIEERSLSDKFVKIFWDGKDEDGDNIANGTYFYRLKVKSNSNNYSEVFTGKISVVK